LRSEIRQRGEDASLGFSGSDEVLDPFDTLGVRSNPVWNDEHECIQRCLDSFLFPIAEEVLRLLHSCVQPELTKSWRASVLLQRGCYPTGEWVVLN
jgi:hypothetical protein